MSLILPSDYHSIDIIKRNEDIRWIPEYEVGDYQLTKPLIKLNLKDYEKNHFKVIKSFQKLCYYLV